MKRISICDKYIVFWLSPLVSTLKTKASDRYGLEMIYQAITKTQYDKDQYFLQFISVILQIYIFVSFHYCCLLVNVYIVSLQTFESNRMYKMNKFVMPIY